MEHTWSCRVLKTHGEANYWDKHISSVTLIFNIEQIYNENVVYDATCAINLSPLLCKYSFTISITFNFVLNCSFVFFSSNSTFTVYQWDILDAWKNKNVNDALTSFVCCITEFSFIFMIRHLNSNTYKVTKTFEQLWQKYFTFTLNENVSAPQWLCVWLQSFITFRKQRALHCQHSL